MSIASHASFRRGKGAYILGAHAQSAYPLPRPARSSTRPTVGSPTYNINERLILCDRGVVRALFSTLGLCRLYGAQTSKENRIVTMDGNDLDV